MVHMINGLEVNVPADGNGAITEETIRQVANVPESRQLILQLPDGRNQIVNPGQKMRLQPRQYFTSAPRHRRGAFRA